MNADMKDLCDFNGVVWSELFNKVRDGLRGDMDIVFTRGEFAVLHDALLIAGE